MDDKEIKSIIESILFVWGGPLHINELARVLDISKEEVKKNVLQLKDEMEKHNRGIRVIQVNDCYQLCTKIESHPYIEKLCITSQNKGLSQPTLEVLAIIAYKQPITRYEIENIRGVKSDKAINTLLERELIEVKGRLDKIGRPILYGTTDVFLKTFGFKSLDELPEVEEIEKLDFLLKKE
ncbi:SMC-Scp complex subunit ScpB [Caminicella sporogenes]|uniref:SMC-Scp complex subunit ScpB n=1 Tax=Caminicella sporogenes TaxID=166485 RepID=UPI0025424048|nr:SMC-Scp complex subunit ScpB [Caminicella sporogenes]WIF94735.1 SMC-Scp complex subunit ScpB [Caminicella sporogenes]